MSFWSGVARGYKDSSEATAKQEELDARRAERDSEFEYRRGRDVTSDKFREEQVKANQAAVDENLRRYKQGRIDSLDQLQIKQLEFNLNKTASGKGENKTPPVKHSLEVLTGLGATNDDIAEFIGRGADAKVLDAAIKAYEDTVDSYGDRPGDAPTVSEFLSETAFTITGGEGLSAEEIIEKMKGLSKDSIYSNIAEKMLTGFTSPIYYNIDTPTVPPALDVTDTNKVISVASENIASSLTDHVNRLQDEYSKTPSDKGLGERLVAAENILKNFTNGTDRQGAIDSYGADTILAILSNAPGAVGSNNFGMFNKAILDRTYTKEEDVLKANMEGELSDGSYYVLNNKIYVLDSKTLKGPPLEFGTEEDFLAWEKENPEEASKLQDGSTFKVGGVLYTPGESTGDKDDPKQPSGSEVVTPTEVVTPDMDFEDRAWYTRNVLDIIGEGEAPQTLEQAATFLATIFAEEEEISEADRSLIMNTVMSFLKSKYNLK